MCGVGFSVPLDVTVMRLAGDRLGVGSHVTGGAGALAVVLGSTAGCDGDLQPTIAAVPG